MHCFLYQDRYVSGVCVSYGAHRHIHACVLHVNHSPHNYHFLVNGLDLLITILPCVHGMCVFMCVCVTEREREGKRKMDRENKTAEVIWLN